MIAFLGIFCYNITIMAAVNFGYSYPGEPGSKQEFEASLVFLTPEEMEALPEAGVAIDPQNVEQTIQDIEMVNRVQTELLGGAGHIPMTDEQIAGLLRMYYMHQPSVRTRLNITGARARQNSDIALSKIRLHETRQPDYTDYINPAR